MTWEGDLSVHFSLRRSMTETELDSQCVRVTNHPGSTRTKDAGLSVLKWGQSQADQDGWSP